MKKTITIIIVVLVIAAAGVGGFFILRRTRLVHNNDNAIGNTAGNLINGGLFCEYNDKIYLPTLTITTNYMLWILTVRTFPK